MAKDRTISCLETRVEQLESIVEARASDRSDCDLAEENERQAEELALQQQQQQLVGKDRTISSLKKEMRQLQGVVAALGDDIWDLAEAYERQAEKLALLREKLGGGMEVTCLRMRKRLRRG